MTDEITPRTDPPRVMNVPADFVEDKLVTPPGWYVAVVDGERTMVEVISDNWGPAVRSNRGKTAIGLFKGMLIARLRLDDLAPVT